MIWMLLGTFFATVLTIDIVLRFYFGRKALDLLEKAPPFLVEKVLPQKQATLFQVETADGITLTGSIYHPEQHHPEGIVIFCPETGGDHWSASRYCQGLMQSRFIVVSFDFRNQGASESMPGYTPSHWVTEYEVADLQAVINWVRQQDGFKQLPIGLMGVSRGAAAAMMALTRCQEIQFLCSDSGYTNDALITYHLKRYSAILLPGWVIWYSQKIFWHIKWTLYAGIWLRSWKRHCRYVLSAQPFQKMRDKQILLISGRNDSYVPTSLAETLRDFFGEQCEQLWIVPKAVHNGACKQQPQLYAEKVTEFFLQMLSAAPDQKLPADAVCAATSVAATSIAVSAD